MNTNLITTRRAHTRLWRMAAALFLLAVFLPVATAAAQAFGRNKVQYEGFDFRVLRSEHFDVHYYPEFAAPANDATRMLERWYGRLSGIFNFTFDKNPIVLYANHPDFQQTNVVGGEINEGTGGVTESIRTRVVLPLTGVYHDNDHVLGHELVHVFQYDMAKDRGGMAGLSRLPLWVIEGLAEYFSIGRRDAHTAMWLRDAIIRDDLPTIKQLSSDPRFFPYRYGQAVWAYIGGRWGDDRAAQLYRRASGAGDFESSLLEMFGMSSDSISRQWHAALRAHYTPEMNGRTDPTKAGKPLVVEKEKGSLNISPVISPDGKMVAFFSQRGLFSVDLFVADASTGEIIKTLASPTSGSHFDNLSFINSAGAWSPDSRKFAFIVFNNGDNEIHILDVASRDIERKIRTEPHAGAITAVSWSPDGTRLAFAGISGGVSDLFVVDATGSNFVRLTNDKYAAIHPVWSNDGRQIAFATDQGPGTNLDILSTGSMRIALIDVESKRLTFVNGFPSAKNINPQFSPDGRSLYFISDVQGFSDIFRVDLASNDVHRVTNLKTGVSGITYLSPALSVSQSTGRLVFSVFSASGTNIYSLEANEAAGTPVSVSNVVSGGADLLPEPRAGIVEGYIADNTTYLPAAIAFPDRPYSSRLGLDYIGAPTIGFTASDYGSGLFGSVSAFFGDMLSNKTLGVALQGQGEFKDYGAQAFYQNASRRLNWALVGGRVPYITGFTNVTQVNPGVPAFQVDQVIRRSYYDQASVLFQYPFSTTRRVEFDVGYTHVSYDTEIFRYLDFGSSIQGPERIDVPSPDPIAFGQATAALVGDNSFFGFTAPIAGGRYRLELTPTFGGINFNSLLVDGRRYLFARPFTFAFRAMHLGRYGADEEDDRLSPLYVGNDQFVRGYDVYSFTAADCSSSGTQASCPEFERLVGSRIAVANAEFRIPLVGPRTLSLIPSSFIPIDLALFADAGMAWTSTESAELRFDRSTTDRVPVFSAGASMRVNLMGFAVLEVFYARPFQRPGRSTVWGLQFAPGW